MGYRLTVVFGGKTVDRKEVHESRFVIGRSRDADLVIDNLGISRAHAEIVLEKSVPTLRDLKSNNGTFVNGRRITRHNLNDGDEIAIGKFMITFHFDEESDADADDEEEEEEESGRRDGEFTVAIDSRLMEQRQRERAHKLKAYLTTGTGGKKRTLVLDRSLFSIGKAATNDFRISGFFNAKRHCIVFRDETSFRLLDTSQKRRTYLNETPIDDERLKDGDTIRVGRYKFKFMVGVPPV